MTVSLTMLSAITRRVQPPRALAVPYPLGYPLGDPASPGLQRAILREMLALCQASEVPFLAGMHPLGGRTPQ